LLITYYGDERNDTHSKNEITAGQSTGDDEDETQDEGWVRLETHLPQSWHSGPWDCNYETEDWDARHDNEQS